MTDITDKALRRLRNTYMLANTPQYLLREFRKDPAIHTYYQSTDIEELVDVIVFIDSMESQDLNSIVRGYAAVVALTYHTLSEVKKATEHITIHRLEWVGDILAAWEGRYNSIDTVNIKGYSPTVVIDSL